MDNHLGHFLAQNRRCQQNNPPPAFPSADPVSFLDFSLFPNHLSISLSCLHREGMIVHFLLNTAAFESKICLDRYSGIYFRGETRLAPGSVHKFLTINKIFT